MFMLPRRALHVPGRWPVPLALGLGVGLLVGYGLSARPGAAAAGPAIACQATPGPATATPVGSGRYTPGPTAGAVKPLPGKTAVPLAPHLVLGMITRPLNVVRTIQREADGGNKGYTWYRDQTAVISHTLPQYGFKPPIHIVSLPKPFPRYAGRPIRKAVVTYEGTLYQVRLAQPLTQGPKGIWVIVTILRQAIQLGGIGQPARVVQHQQHLADTDKASAFYRDPAQVILRNAPQYGLQPPLALVGKPAPVASSSGRPTEHAILTSQGVPYDVYVTQFGVRGPRGIWSYTFIDVRQP